MWLNRRAWRWAIARTGQLRVGTSGYSYKQWKGNFYPEKLPDREMLSFYATQLSTVEINGMASRAVPLAWHVSP